jgi:hypothetical protein
MTQKTEKRLSRIEEKIDHLDFRFKEYRYSGVKDWDVYDIKARFDEIYKYLGAKRVETPASVKLLAPEKGANLCS